MTKAIRVVVAGTMLVLAAMVPAAAQQSQPGTRPQGAPNSRPSQNLPAFTWWKSGAFKVELGLTADQSVRIDKIWETARPELRREWDELSRLEAKLSDLIQKDADESVLSRQIDRVETARASANKTRALMLVQMRKVLTPDQRDRLDGIRERWRRELPARPSLPSEPGKPKER